MYITAYLHAPSNVWAVKQFDKIITREEYNERELFYLFFAENTVAVSYFADKEDMRDFVWKYLHGETQYQYLGIVGYYQPTVSEQYRRIANLLTSEPKKYDEPAKVYDLAAYRQAKQKGNLANGKIL